MPCVLGSCNPLSGSCDCHAHVMGDQCDQCMPGFMGAGCNEAKVESNCLETCVNGKCSPTTGLCECFSQWNGEDCDVPEEAVTVLDYVVDFMEGFRIYILVTSNLLSMLIILGGLYFLLVPRAGEKHAAVLSAGYAPHVISDDNVPGFDDSVFADFEPMQGDAGPSSSSQSPSRKGFTSLFRRSDLVQDQEGDDGEEVTLANENDDLLNFGLNGDENDN